MTVYLLRHGATAYNAEHRYLGKTDIPLSPEGVKELRRADSFPQTVYVSPMLRAKQTADVLFPEAKQIEVPDLREMDFGAFEGRNYIEMEHDAAYRVWVDGGCVGPTPGGESKAEFSDRVCEAFAALVDKALAEEQPMLVILAHGGTQMAALERYALPRRDYYDWLGPLAGGFVLEADAETWSKSRTLRLVQTVRYTKEPV